MYTDVRKDSTNSPFVLCKWTLTRTVVGAFFALFICGIKYFIYSSCGSRRLLTLSFSLVCCMFQVHSTTQCAMIFVVKIILVTQPLFPIPTCDLTYIFIAYIVSIEAGRFSLFHFFPLFCQKKRRTKLSHFYIGEHKRGNKKKTGNSTRVQCNCLSKSSRIHSLELFPDF
jgi:hypothetical protein